ncbi:MAG TPA: hypothetical protein PKY01_16065, partial [Candidatus Hydrogenedentes bacterium]|nr:hypothetical protein [Candidatus Hydrogenedentota bacterium]
MPLATGAAGYPTTAGLVQNPRSLRININTGHRRIRIEPALRISHFKQGGESQNHPGRTASIPQYDTKRPGLERRP